MSFPSLFAAGRGRRGRIGSTAAGLGGDLGGPVVAVAEHGGDDWCRGLEDELAQGGGAPAEGGDPGPAQAPFDGVRGHRLAGAAAGERRMLHLAASLADRAPVSLGEAVTGIDDRNVDLLLTAIRHASGRHQFPR